LALEESLQQFRVLVKSGHYNMDEEITTVVLQPKEKQEQYADWLKGRAVMGSIIAHHVKVKIKHSKTAKKITDRETSGYSYGSGESIMWVITPDEEAAIVAECKEYSDKKTAKRAENNSTKKAHKDAIFAKAKATGEKQVLDNWVTRECTENQDDCSFDAATEWALPNGSVKTTFSHCH